MTSSIRKSVTTFSAWLEFRMNFFILEHDYVGQKHVCNGSSTLMCVDMEIMPFPKKCSEHAADALHYFSL